MAVTKSPKKSFDKLLHSLKQDRPDITFKEGRTFSWSPKNETITYTQGDDEETSWSLLHEFAHAQLGHTTYQTDFELLTLEVAAWEKSKQYANNFNITIDKDHIEDCLDSYRDWLHRRSTCPTCGNAGLQKTETQYSCHNCHSYWRVSAARFCRPYRRKIVDTLKETELTQTNSSSTFH